MKSRRVNRRLSSGFMLIEVLIALALFGLSAVFLVDGAFVAARTIRVMKDTREMEQDLLWVRSQVFQEADYEKMRLNVQYKNISVRLASAQKVNLDIFEPLKKGFSLHLNLPLRSNHYNEIE